MSQTSGGDFSGVSQTSANNSLSLKVGMVYWAWAKNLRLPRNMKWPAVVNENQEVFTFTENLM